MSFVVTVYVPEAIVMASDSRQTVTLKNQAETVSSDFAYKTFLLSGQQVGVSTFGQAALGGVGVQSQVDRFAEEVVEEGDDVETVAQKLIRHLHERYPDVDTGFYVAGFKREGRASIPHVYYCPRGRGGGAPKHLKLPTGELT